MDLVEIKILETVIAIVLFFLLRLGISKLISRTVTKSLLQKRKKGMRVQFKEV